MDGILLNRPTSILRWIDANPYRIHLFDLFIFRMHKDAPLLRRNHTRAIEPAASANGIRQRRISLPLHIHDQFYGRIAFGHPDQKTRVVCNTPLRRGRMLLPKTLCRQTRIRRILIQTNLTIHGIAIKTPVDDVKQCTPRKFLRTCNEQMRQNVFIRQQPLHCCIIRLAKPLLAFSPNLITKHDCLLCCGAPMPALSWRMMTSVEICDAFF